MIREEQYILGHRPYAVRLASFRVIRDEPEHSYAWLGIDAAWFRRRRRNAWSELATVACAGELRELMKYPLPASAEEFLAAFTDGRYGGRCAARWDGHTLWAPELGEDERARYKALLVPMLAAWPAIPPLHDGWYTFRA